MRRFREWISNLSIHKSALINLNDIPGEISLKTIITTMIYLATFIIYKFLNV